MWQTLANWSPQTGVQFSSVCAVRNSVNATLSTLVVGRWRVTVQSYDQRHCIFASGDLIPPRDTCILRSLWLLKECLFSAYTELFSVVYIFQLSLKAIQEFRVMWKFRHHVVLDWLFRHLIWSSLLISDMGLYLPLKIFRLDVRHVCIYRFLLNIDQSSVSVSRIVSKYNL